MDYKKEYEEKLSKAITLHKLAAETNNDNTRMALEELYPELKESEDEKIRKEIVEYIKIHQRVIKDEGHIQQANDIEKWIVWLEKQGSKEERLKEHNICDTCEESNGCAKLLEKQGEQKTVSKTEPIVEGLTTEFQKQVSHLIASAMDKEHEYTKGYVEWVAQSLLGYAKNEQTPSDKVEPKFKVGDWCIDNEDNTIFQITKVLSNLYYYRTNEGKEYSCTRDSIERDAHLWTIKDAKDGDVLALDWEDEWHWQKIVIFKSLNEFGVEGYGNTFKNNKLAFIEDVLYYSKTWSKCLYPATKEQRDLLFTKMKETGYE